MRDARRLLSPIVAGLAIAGCGKTAAPTADSAAASSTTSATANFDEAAARHEILADDSAFVRAMLAKNVDSLMPYYDDNVVSLGKNATKGTADVRAAYTQAVKSNPRDISFQSGGVNFSADHSMAWDYGTVSQTSDVNGKPVKTSGTFLNVWKNVGGRWKIVAEISSL